MASGTILRVRTYVRTLLAREGVNERCEPVMSGSSLVIFLRFTVRTVHTWSHMGKTRKQRRRTKEKNTKLEDTGYVPFVKQEKQVTYVQLAIKDRPPVVAESAINVYVHA